MSREPRIALEMGAIAAVWVVAMLGCQPGDTRHSGSNAPSNEAQQEVARETAPTVGATERSGDAAGESAAALQALNEQALNEQPANEQPANEQATNEQATNEQATNEQLPAGSPPEKSPTLDTPPTAPPESTAAGPDEEASSADTQPPKPVVPATQEDSSAAPRVATATDNEARDPTKQFEDWPEPQFVFMLTGQQKGYIEPCGCTGLENQKGGLVRRHSLVKQLKARGWQVVPLDAGNQVRRVGRQAEIKFQMTLEGLNTIGYEAITLGKEDLRLSIGELVAATATFDEQSSPFVSANVAVLDRSLTPQYRVIEAGGQKIGVTAVIGDEWLKDLSNDEILHSPAAESLRQVTPELKAAKCDHYVLLAHASLDESRRLAEQFPLFDLVVTAGALGDPTFQPERVGDHEAMFAQVGVKGMYVGVVGVFTEAPYLRYQRIALDDSLEDSPAMLNLLASYQTQLKNLGLEGLGVKPLPHPSGLTFVGSEKCGECHSTAFEIWESSAHAHATDSLVHPGERSEIPRHFDPECLSCHVTGWNPQRYFPYTTGYLGLEASPQMHASGCENCHGPGSLHVAAESGEVDLGEDDLLASREAMRLPLAKAELHCMTCHDLDNSPDFHDEGAFQTYWEMVEHYGLD